MNVWIIIDTSYKENDKKWIVDGLNKSSQWKTHCVYSFFVLSRLSRKGFLFKVLSHIITILQCIYAIIRSKKNDVFVVWQKKTALYLNFLSGGRKNIISMNWLTPTKIDYKEYGLLKKLAQNVHSTLIVNSPDSVSKWTVFFKLSKINFSVIHDVYDECAQFESISKKDDYFFTGGMNNRDWSLVAELAECNPSKKFICVALKKDFEEFVSVVPKNMTVYYNIPTKEYYKLMKNASLVIMPLLDDRVAGLINILKSASFGVACMVTKTAATEQYYSNDSKKLLIENRNDWFASLQNWIDYSENEKREATKNFQLNIKKNFAPSRAAEKIVDIINLYKESTLSE